MAGFGNLVRTRRDRNVDEVAPQSQTAGRKGTRTLTMLSKLIRFAVLLNLIPLAAMQLAAQAGPSFDIVITNGHIIDGTGSPWYSGDLGIRDGKIAAIGGLAGAPARRTVDAKGMIVAPGFIDMLGQSEVTILVNPHLPSKIFQGITTEVTGEGGSVAPLNDAVIQADRVAWEHYGITPTWRTY